MLCYSELVSFWLFDLDFDNEAKDNRRVNIATPAIYIITGIKYSFFMISKEVFNDKTIKYVPV